MNAESSNPIEDVTGNPSFTKGAAESHPIALPEGSLLATRPDIVEALEAVHLLNNPGTRETRSDENIEPLNIGLALDGLRWLGDHLRGREPAMARIAVKDAQKHYSYVLEDQQNLPREQAQASPPSPTRSAKQTLAPAQTERLELAATARRQLEQTVSQLAELAPELDCTSFLALSQESTLIKEDHGFVARSRPHLQPELARRIGEYLDDPQNLLNDLTVAASLYALASTNEHAGENLVLPYIRLITIGLDHALRSSRYKPARFTPGTIGRWHGLLQAVPAELKPEDLKELPNTGGNLELIALRSTLAYGQRILSNTLQAMANKEPKPFMDGLYTVAEMGFKPEQTLKSAWTFDIIKDCLKHNKMTGLVLMHEAVFASGTLRGQEALDLQLLLEKAGVPQNQLGLVEANVISLSAESIQRLNPGHRLPKSQLRKIADTYFSSLRNASAKERLDYMKRHAKLYEDVKQAFLDRAVKGDGVETLYGRFLAGKIKLVDLGILESTTAKTSDALDALLPQVR